MCQSNINYVLTQFYPTNVSWCRLTCPAICCLQNCIGPTSSLNHMIGTGLEGVIPDQQHGFRINVSTHIAINSTK